MQASLDMIVDMNQIQFLLREAHDCLSAHSSSSTARTTAMVFSSQRGRQSYHITEEQIQFLIDHRFTVQEIVSLLGVGIRTVESWMNDFQIEHCKVLQQNN